MTSALLPSPTTTGAGVATLAITEPTLRLALAFVLDDAGWRRSTSGGLGVATVADVVPSRPDRPPVDVLVVHPCPAQCHLAVRALALGQARAVLDARQPERLPDVLHAVMTGLAVLPHAVIDAAREVPPLSERLGHTLELVLAGRSNTAIARTLHESESTAKRDVAELLRLFDVTNRLTLVASAVRLGYRPR
jgi:DNA-binding NarL/FixJ family response regulator